MSERRPVGPEVAVAGSVNQAAIFEAKPGESIGDIVGFSGRLEFLADDRRLVVQRLKDLDAAGSRQLSIDEARTFPAERGDIVRILSIAPSLVPSSGRRCWRPSRVRSTDPAATS